MPASDRSRTSATVDETPEASSVDLMAPGPFGRRLIQLAAKLLAGGLINLYLFVQFRLLDNYSQYPELEKNHHHGRMKSRAGAAALPSFGSEP
jgi:hypothetical protein